MNTCYVCEAVPVCGQVIVMRDEKMLCTGCVESYTLLRALAQRMQAYSKPELFQDVQLKMENEGTSFNFPVIIRAEHRSTESQRWVYVRETGSIYFGSRAQSSKLATAEQVNELLNECRTKYGNAWMFEVWSNNAFEGK